MSPTSNCIDPGTVSAYELFAWAHGEATSTVRAHVATCAACQAQAREYLHVRGLLVGLHRADCPSTEALTNYAFDLLSAEERTSVAAHVVSCGRCTDELAVLRADMAEPVVSAPATAPVLERLARAIATLVTPPAPQLEPAGGYTSPTRGATSRAAQPATYAVGDIEITVHVTSADTRVPDAAEPLTVRGLVRSPLHPAAMLARSRVDLLRGETIVASADVNERGHFTLNKLPTGEFTLQVSFPDHAVVIPTFSLARNGPA